MISLTNVLVLFISWIYPSKTLKLLSIIRDGQLCFYCFVVITCLMKDLEDASLNNSILKVMIPIPSGWRIFISVSMNDFFTNMILQIKIDNAPIWCIIGAVIQLSIGGIRHEPI